MALSRRQLLAGIGGIAAASLGAQPKRTGPLLCLYSRVLPQVDLYELGTVLSGMGFDGCDLSVQPGGTMHPQQTPVDLVRIIETLSGQGIEVPVVTTSFLSSTEPWARNVLYVAGGTGISLFRPGYWKLPAARVADLKNQIPGLAAMARAYGMGIGLPTTAGEGLMRGLDPQWAGWDFDPSQTTSELTLEMTAPRLKMLVLTDFRREGDRTVACPLGEGQVDWGKFFDTLAHAKFSGPLSLQLDYRPADPPAAIRRDLEFARKHLNEAYQKVTDATPRRQSAERSA